MKRLIKKKEIIVLSVLLSIAIVLLVFLYKLHPVDRMMKSIYEDKGKSVQILKVMMTPNYPPYEFINKQGDPYGFDYDLLMAIADVMGVEVELTTNVWDITRSAIENGEVDLITGMNYSEDRNRVVEFSKPIIINSHAVFVRNGSDITSIEDTKGKTVIVQRGDIANDLLISDSLDLKLVTVDDGVEFVKRLSAGDADFGINSRYIGEHQIKLNNIDNLHSVGPALWHNYYCMAINKGDTALVKTINSGLNIIKKNGTYAAIYNKWFGVAEDAERVRWDKLKRYLLWGVLGLLIVVLIGALWSYGLKRRVKMQTLQIRDEIDRRRDMETELQEKHHILIDRNSASLALQQELTKRNQEIEEQNVRLRLANQKADEKDRLKMAFFANMSHEIRTPLNGIINFTELFEATQPKSEERNLYLDIILKSSDQLLSIIDDVMEISRIEAGELTLRNVQLSVNSLLQDLYLLFTSLAAKEQLKLSILGDTLEQEVNMYGDEQKLKQIFNNLLYNAIRYTPDGDIRFGCLNKGRELEFFIEDTGIGIAAERVNHIFDRRNALHLKSDSTIKGNGIGLSICKGLVDLMGGSIHVKSALGCGARFYFHLPLSKNSDSLDQSL